jgi:thymidylate kinase
MMAAIALIGPDGAGKTTLTTMLVESGVLPFRYLYMGINTGSSNIALPSSRLAERARARLGSTPGQPGQPGQPGRRGRVWRVARLLNRVAEEWFRQGISWYYQARGFTVLYDRHFIFDFSGEMPSAATEPLDKRVHRWLLQVFYPQPDMVILLDAPGALLHARKGESSPAELEQRRQALLREGTRRRGVVRVDATRPLPHVYAEIEGLIISRFGGRAATGTAAPPLSKPV